MDCLLMNWERVSYVAKVSGRAVNFIRFNVLIESKSNGRGVRGLVSREIVVKEDLDRWESFLAALSPLSALRVEVDVYEYMTMGNSRVERRLLDMRVS